MNKLCEFISWCIYVFIAVLTLFYGTCGLAVVNGESMLPTLNDGDLLVFCRFIKPDVGDIVIADIGDDSKTIVKRVVAKAGDQLDIIDNQVFLNGVLQEEDYIKEKDWYGSYSSILEEKELFLLGDNRNNSKDSRSFGTVYEKNILGTCVFNISSIVDISYSQLQNSILILLLLALLFNICISQVHEEESHAKTDNFR